MIDNIKTEHENNGVFLPVALAVVLIIGMTIIAKITEPQTIDTYTLSQEKELQN